MAPDLKTLASRIDSLESSNIKDDAKIRDIFVDLARIRLDAEANGDASTTGLVDDLRKRLRLHPPHLSILSRICMTWRLVLTMVVTAAGCFMLFLLSPLRLTHPLLRRLGVPNGLLPLDLCGLLWAKSVLATAGVHVKFVGEDASIWSRASHGIVVYNHASNLDPFIVRAACGWHRAPKFVGKKVLFAVPVFGWSAAATGHIPINRGDRTKSIDTLNERVVGIMNKWGRSVAISPEGTRTKDGHLVLPFKKGVFHLSQRAHAPLFPIVVRGAFSIYPPERAFATTGVVTVRMLDVQPCHENNGDTSVPVTDQARMELQKVYLEQMSRHREEDQAGPMPLWKWICDACFVLAMLWIYFHVGRGCISILSIVGVEGAGIAVFFAVATVTISLMAHHFL